MLTRNEFISRVSGVVYTEDESMIDLILEDIDINGEPVVDLFYTSPDYDGVAIDFGGGVYGITCRDVLELTENDALILRRQLGMRATKQNRLLCEEILRLCRDEVARSGYIF